MALDELQKKKLAKIMRFLIPLLLAGMFACLAVFQEKGLFSKAGAAAAVVKKPARVAVPLTRLAVSNRLENEGFSVQADGTLYRNDYEAGTLTFKQEGEVFTAVTYSLSLLPEEAYFPEGDLGEEMRKIKALDAENARLVLSALLEAVLGDTLPSEKAVYQAQTRLSACLSAEKEISLSCSQEGCRINLVKTLNRGEYTLTMEAIKE